MAKGPVDITRAISVVKVTDDVGTGAAGLGRVASKLHMLPMVQQTCDRAARHLSRFCK